MDQTSLIQNTPIIWEPRTLTDADWPNLVANHIIIIIDRFQNYFSSSFNLVVEKTIKPLDLYIHKKVNVEKYEFIKPAY